MKRILCLTVTVLLFFNLVISCNSEIMERKEPAKAPSPPMSQPTLVGSSGTVLETMNTGGYTYVKIDTGSEKVWVAATEFQVKVGDKVTFTKGLPMKDYFSKTLNRTFDLVYFVSDINVLGSDTIASKSPHEKTSAPSGGTGISTPTPIDFSGIEKPKGGKTIAEIYAKKDDLSGKEVTVRGKVVKFNRNIMGKNWIHLQDGTGDKGANDLTITTSTTAKVGDTVLARGMVTMNKDFGYGYKYDIIIEDATIKIE